MGHMKAEGLHNGLPFLKVHDKLLIDVRRKQFSVVYQLLGVIQAVADLLRGIPVCQGLHRLLPEGVGELLRLLHIQDTVCEIFQNIVHLRVYRVHGTAVDIQDDVITIVNVLMNQNCSFLLRTTSRQVDAPGIVLSASCKYDVSFPAIMGFRLPEENGDTPSLSYLFSFSQV